MHSVDRLSTDICIEKKMHTGRTDRRKHAKRESPGNGLDRRVRRKKKYLKRITILFSIGSFFIVATAAAAASMKAKKQKQRGLKEERKKNSKRNYDVDHWCWYECKRIESISTKYARVRFTSRLPLRVSEKREKNIYTFLHRRSSVHQTRKFFWFQMNYFV